jgi:hypothetical protein
VIPQLLWIRSIRQNVTILFFHFTGRERRHVAGTVRHRRDQLAPGLSAVVVGNVLPDAMGLGDVYRHDRFVLDVDIPVRALPAGDFDLRNAGNWWNKRRARSTDH